MSDNNKKKALCVATVASNLDNFNRSNVELLKELGYEVTLAANFRAEEDSSPKEKIDAFAEEMRTQGVEVIQIDFSRHPGKIRQQICSIRQVKRLLKENRYDLIHCHTPIASLIVRVLANRYRSKAKRTRVIYTAHGFHFFKGAPKKNWLVYYPLEKWASRFTDVLITINEEDYEIASKKFHAGLVVRIPGIGVDTERYIRLRENPVIREERRKVLGLSEEDILLISVGELNSNKNHELAIRSIGELVRNHPEQKKKLTYLICGQGELRSNLENLIDDLDIRNIVTILGFREDVPEFLAAADLFLFPSKREGLPLSLMEAMSAGLPAVVTDVRGSRELVCNEENGFVVGFDEKQFAERLNLLIKDESLRGAMGRQALRGVGKYDAQNVRERMKEIYSCNVKGAEVKH